MRALTLALALLAALVAVAGAVDLDNGGAPALVEEKEAEGASHKLWFHLDQLMNQKEGGSEAPMEANSDSAASESSDESPAAKDKKGGSTTVLANKNFMSIMEDTEGRELSPHLAAAEGRLEAHEAARKREHEAHQKRSGEQNKKHRTHMKMRADARQRQKEAAAAKGRALEEVQKAQAQTAALNKKTEELRKKVQEQNQKKQAKLFRFATGWKDYGGSYERAEAIKSGEFCTLAGLVRRSIRRDYRIIGTLPAVCKPKYQLIFHVEIGAYRNGGNEARVDVLRDGRVHLTMVNRGATGDVSWLSLSGIRFKAAAPDAAVSLVNSWRPYGGAYGSPAGYAEQSASGGRICSLMGLIKAGRWGYLGRVNQNSCWPSHRLVFNGNNHQAVTRVDLLNNGYFLRNGGAARHGWVSLSSMVYPGRGSQSSNLPLATSFRHYDTNNWGPAQYHRVGNVCMLSGLVRRTRGNKAARAQIGRLPRGCRPGRRLIFAGNSHSVSARVDVSPNGYVEYMSGASASWISLSGINFVARN